MAKKRQTPRDAESELSEVADDTLPGGALDLSEIAIKCFRIHLGEVIEERWSGQPPEPEASGRLAELVLASVLRMIAPAGDFPLSSDEFCRLVRVSPFGEKTHDRAASSELHVDAEAATWKVQNQRRVALIRDSLSHRLTPEEERELERLQADADKRLEAHDDALLKQLQSMKKAVEQLPDGS